MMTHNSSIADNLPAFTKQVYELSGELVDHYDKGYPLGFMGTDESGGAGKAHIYNHVRINLHYHEVTDNAYRVVGFEVEPHSVHHTYTKWNEEDPKSTQLTSCPLITSSGYQVIDVTKSTDQEVVFTYDVSWAVSC